MKLTSGQFHCADGRWPDDKLRSACRMHPGGPDLALWSDVLMPTIKPSQRRVLNFLRSYRHPRTGECTPTLREIATAVGLSTSQARVIVADLVQDHSVESVTCWVYPVPDQGNTGVRFTPPRPITDATPDELLSFGFKRGPNLYRVLTLVLLTIILMLPQVTTAKGLSALASDSYATLWMRPKEVNLSQLDSAL